MLPNNTQVWVLHCIGCTSTVSLYHPKMEVKPVFRYCPLCGSAVVQVDITAMQARAAGVENATK